MDAAQLKTQLENALQSLSFVTAVELKVEQSILDGQVFLEYDCFVQVYFKSEWLKFSFNLIAQNQRIGAIDKDNRNGWHRHPLHDVKIHEKIAEKSIEEVVEELKIVWEETKPKLKTYEEINALLKGNKG